MLRSPPPDPTVSRSVLAASTVAALVAGGCVAYAEDAATLESIATAAAEREVGPLAWIDAVRRTWSVDPSLTALAAEAAATRAAASVPFELRGEWRSGMETVALMVDPIALLGYGPRGGAIGVAEAEAVAAVAELAAARWSALAEVTEAWLVDAALRDLPPLAAGIGVDGETFRSAGLASALAVARLDAAAHRLDAERAARDLAREQNLARLRQRLGLDATAALQIVPGGVPDLGPDAVPAAVLTRPDLAVRLARFRSADAAFRAAVADQYPSLRIGPELSYAGNPLEVMGMLRIPVLRGGLAEAARHRREAARARLEAAWLAADNAAAVALREHRTAVASHRAAAARADAAARALDVATAGLDVEIDAFDAAAAAAMEQAMAASALREAAIAEVGARVRLAVARGWPAGSRLAAEVHDRGAAMNEGPR